MLLALTKLPAMIRVSGQHALGNLYLPLQVHAPPPAPGHPAASLSS